MKQCKSCGDRLPESDFYRYRDGRPRPTCKKCHQAYSRAWCVANPERRRAQQRRAYRKQVESGSARERWLVDKYGLSLADFNERCEAQQGRCLICALPVPCSDFHVDHNHETGVVRGLLCGLCNRGLGQFNDDVERLRAAIQYLENQC